LSDTRGLPDVKHPGEPVLPLAALLPGIAAVTLVDLLAFAGRWPAGGAGALLPLLLLGIPWLTLVSLRYPARALGYRRAQAVLDLGWGVAAGSVWRLASLLFNLALLGAGAGSVFTGLLGVPFVEETFFRGYLGRNLAPRVGRWWANLLQSLLFSLQPAHLAQGWPAMGSIFAFGLLAGWLTARRRSIWPALGAHAAANALVLLLN